ncbi:MAG: glutamyl-tRNA reductase [Chloroflexi bacterium]|nr:glutamyl-tRNA reductase [Chloroflexota bacterium]
MHISLIGVNHVTAPVSIREKVAIGTQQLADTLSSLRIYTPWGVILSTCNRTEVYTVDENAARAGKAGLDFYKSLLNTSDVYLLQHAYHIEDQEAVKHLFHVASGLDSQITGEYEVLGQVGNSLDAAEKAGTVNLPLRQLFQSAIRTGRRVRDETGISRNALSISSVAVALAAQAVGNFEKCRMLVIGAGEAGKLVAKAAKERGTRQIVVANRTRERAQELAETLGGIPTGMENLDNELGTTDIVVTCAAAPHPLIHARNIKDVMKKRPELPLVIIDIALPRNVEPEVGKLENVFLYNIDDLNHLSETNRKERESETQMAAKIVAEEIDKFLLWWQTLEVTPIVSALTRKAEEIRSNQLEQTLKKLHPLSDEERESLEAMTRAIVNKLLNDPIQCVKADKNNGYAKALAELFRLKLEKH